MIRPRHLFSLAALAALGIGATAANAAPDEKLRAMLPERIRTAGVITVGTDPQQPPYDFYDKDNTTLIGLEQDLAAAMADKLGVTFKFAPAQFASIIPAVQASRFDMGISAFGDFVQREKVVDEIDYTTEATGIIVVEGNPHHITKISDACGLKAAAVQGSIPLELLDKQKGLCPADKPLEVLQFPTNDQMALAVRSGRADLMMDTYGVAAFTLEHQPESAGGSKLELVPGARYAIGYQAMVVRKDDPQLRDAVVAALEALIADGTYHKIFAKWGLTDNEVKQITVNDAGRWKDYLKLDQ
jgi:polar amino acid transport system substrate-binding protein